MAARLHNRGTMGLRTTLLALLAMTVFAVRVQTPAQERCCEQRHCETSHANSGEIRVARVARTALIAALADGDIDSLLGLESRGSGDREGHRALAAVAHGDRSHAVLEVSYRGDVVPLVVLAE